MGFGVLERLARTSVLAAGLAGVPAFAAASPAVPDSVTFGNQRPLNDAELQRLNRRYPIISPMPCDAPQYIIIHSSEGWNSRPYIRRNGLAHYSVDLQGVPWSVVPPIYSAHHTGVARWDDQTTHNAIARCSIGVEFDGFSNPYRVRGDEIVHPEPRPADQLHGGRLFIEYLRDRFDIPLERILPHAFIAATDNNGIIDLGKRRGDGIELMLALGYPLPPCTFPAMVEEGIRLDPHLRRRILYNENHPGDSRGFFELYGGVSSNPGDRLEYYVDTPLTLEEELLYTTLPLQCEKTLQTAPLGLPPVWIAAIDEEESPGNNAPVPPPVPEPIYALVPDRNVQVTRSARRPA
jgi:hypothetical protein